MTKITSFSTMFSRLVAWVGLFTLALVFVAPSFADAAILNRQLEVGMSGSDVSAVQTFLAQDVTLYPQGLVTGYFGFLTKAAVSNYQVRNGISAVGRIGPVTLASLNIQMSTGSADVSSAMIYNVNIIPNGTSATVNWSTSELARGVVYYSNTPLTTYERINSVDVSGLTAMTDSSARSSQSVSISGLSRNTTYYYLIYSTDQVGNVSVTWPSTFYSN